MAKPIIEHAVEVKTTTTTHYKISVDADALRWLLKAVTGKDVPANATIVVHVPGGGDWSHCDLDLKEHPAVVQWSTNECS